MEKTASQKIDQPEEELRILIKERKEETPEQLFQYIKDRFLIPIGKKPFSTDDIDIVLTFLFADISEKNYQNLSQYLSKGNTLPLSTQNLRNLRAEYFQYIIQASHGKVDGALGASLLSTYQELGERSSNSKWFLLCLRAAYNPQFLVLFKNLLKLSHNLYKTFSELKLMQDEDEWVKYRSWLEDKSLEYSFGNYLKWLRESKNLSYREASDKTGVEHSHLYHLERNDKSPSRDTAIKITENLDGNRSFGQIAAGYWPLKWESNEFLFSLFDREQSFIEGKSREIDSEQYDSLGELLKDLRKERGLTQVEVTSRLPISREYLSDLETGYRTNPSFRILDYLAEFYHIDLEVFREFRK